jgi:ABC-type multidrug transport system fused ATPase/permease subunit
VLRRADQIVVLEAGRVDGQGSLQELLTSNKEMQYLWHTGGLEMDAAPTELA